MGKFEVEMEIQGFKLRVKAERNEDIPRITGQIGRHLAGLVQPTAEIVDEHSPKQIESMVQPRLENDQYTGKGKGRGKSGRRRNGNGELNGSQPLNWQHKPEKWGTPRQSWTAGQKILWTLYVVSKEVNQAEVGGPVIAETFNAHFRQSGPLRKKNMPRDLSSLKLKSPAQVMDNTTKNPIAWYLTEEGIKEAERLVLEAKGTTSAVVGGI